MKEVKFRTYRFCWWCLNGTAEFTNVNPLGTVCPGTEKNCGSGKNVVGKSFQGVCYKIYFQICNVKL